jgi:plasmid stabilization system protein ParE
VVRPIRDEVQRVGRMPGIGHMRKDLASEALRFWGVCSYLIVYRPDTNLVEVLDIIHGARDVATILRNRGLG